MQLILARETFMLFVSILIILAKSIRCVNGRRTAQCEINLTAVIVAVTDDRPRVLVVEQSGEIGLPSGPFDPIRHDSL